MSPLAISSIVFATVFGCALLGFLMQAILPEHHLSPASQSAVNLGMALVGTMAALLLGLLVALAESSYDTVNSELTHMSADVVLLDRMLAHYGSETKEARDLLRRTVATMLDRVWSSNVSSMAKLDPEGGGGEFLFDKIQQLSPKNDSQRSIQTQAISMAISLGQTRWLLFEQSQSSISITFLVVLVFWPSVLFASFGVFAPRNLTVIISLLLAALAVSGAIFLMFELTRPFEGLAQVSSAPLRNAFVHLGR